MISLVIAIIMSVLFLALLIYNIVTWSTTKACPKQPTNAGCIGPTYKDAPERVLNFLKNIQDHVRNTQTGNCATLKETIGKITQAQYEAALRSMSPTTCGDIGAMLRAIVADEQDPDAKRTATLIVNIWSEIAKMACNGDAFNAVNAWNLVTDMLKSFCPYSDLN
jgi:hypothetical protein